MNQTSIQAFFYSMVLCLLFPFAYAQQNVEAILMDAQTKETIPYASIHIVNQKKGTFTDRQGFFQLQNISPKDSVVISFIGYHPLVLKPNTHFNKDTLFLKRKVEKLQEVLILSDNTLLYRLLDKSKKTQSRKLRKAKTYFSLETYTGNKKVELLECYYNGEFRGYDVQDLQLKNGRIALAEFDNRFFVSTETSVALNKYSTFKNNIYFPDSPLRYSKRKMKKRFHLDLISQYKGDENQVMYVIDFTPKSEDSLRFSGTVWLDSSSSQIHKIAYRTKNAGIYPFDPIWDKDSLIQVDLEISKTFENLAGEMFVKSIDFDYSLYYQDRHKNRYSTSTKAVLYAYNYEELFTQPVFNFEKARHSDYLRINASPYNHFFWKNTQEFLSASSKKQNEIFLQEKAALNGESLFQSNAYFKKGFIKHTYTPWNKDRIEFANGTPENMIHLPTRGKTPSERYKFVVQMYMDINQIGDSVHLLTQTIFDPYKSFYYFPKTKTGTAFINMYFDLMEIERQKFEKEIRAKSLTVKEIQTAYERKLVDLESLSKRFFKDVKRGQDMIGMVKWNTYIIEHLNIDNLDLFELHSTNELSTSISPL